MENLIKVKSILTVLDDSYSQKISQYNADMENGINTFQEKPQPPTAQYVTKYINPAAYQFNAIYLSWDADRDCPLAILELTNLVSEEETSMSLCMTEKEFEEIAHKFNYKPYFEEMPSVYIPFCSTVIPDKGDYAITTSGTNTTYSYPDGTIISNT